MNKRESILLIEELGLNTHEYEVVTRGDDLAKVCERYKNSTVRFDADSLGSDLPFFILKEKEYAIGDLYSIAQMAKRNSYAMIVSNGLNYDDLLTFNVKIYFEIDGDFRADISARKVPLREMYNYPLMGVCGNIRERYQDWYRYGTHCGDMRDVKRIVYQTYCTEVLCRYIECTSYSQKVGKKNEDMIFWQIHN